MRAACLLLCLYLSAACSSSEEDHPPEFKPDASGTAPRKCDEVRQGEVQGGAIWLDGGPAACAAPGMECPVFDVDTFAGACAKGTPLASCQNFKWVVSCDLDSGTVAATSDAPDAGPDAQSGDASAD